MNKFNIMDESYTRVVVSLAFDGGKVTYLFLYH